MTDKLKIRRVVRPLIFGQCSNRQEIPLAVCTADVPL